LAELELARLRGLYVSMEHVSFMVTDAFSIVRTGVLGIPNCLAMRMPPEVSREVFAIATDAVHDELTELSETRVLEAAQQEGVPA